MLVPEAIQNLITALLRLPGIGPKTASRLAFFLLRAPEEYSRDLAEALTNLKTNISYCQTCFNITTSGQPQCKLCDDQSRDRGIICVVEEPLDVIALERTAAYNGLYHVLHGVLSPIEGIGPENLKIQELLVRVQKGDVKEIILATNPSMEGDYTAAYLQQLLNPFGIRMTRLARGLPIGGDLEYADQNTLLRALSGRQEIF